ncbi:glycosyltransferase [Mesorhizobium sp. M1169]|uniref:glycosyltransferase n=1 Tax=Mesorhizobium sp. M1169 TaxID=2957066 RepID=UPI00333BEF42
MIARLEKSSALSFAPCRGDRPIIRKGSQLHILHVTPCYYPATFWGGPIFSTLAICDAMSKTPGMKVEVLTTDAAGLNVSDRVSAVSRPDFGYSVHYARRVAGHSISLEILLRLIPAIRRCDVVHLTATYSFPTIPTLFLARLFRKPVVWSPRGAIQATEQWAQSPRKRLKRLFQSVARRICPPITFIHTTAEEERSATASAMPGLPVVVIPNSVDIPPQPNRVQAIDGALRLIFLSRLHPKKGLDRLMSAMEQLPERVSLDIYGTGDPVYVAHLTERAATFGGRVRLRGHVDGAAKFAAFAEADLFVLPTFAENFGIAIAEALAHGLPVLTTTATPWKELESRGCGLCIEPENGDIAKAITELSQRDLRSMGLIGRRWVVEEFSPAASGKAFAALYETIWAHNAASGTNNDRRISSKC